MKKTILLSLLILFSISVMSQEKGLYLSIWGGVGPSGLQYKMSGVDFAKTKRQSLWGGQAGIGASYYFTKHIGLTLGMDFAHYRTKASLFNDFLDMRYKYFDLGIYHDNDYVEGHITDYNLRVRTQNWEEFQSVKMFEIPILLNLQTKFGDKEYFGVYLSTGFKFQFPIASRYYIVDGENGSDAEKKLMVAGWYWEHNVELGGFNRDGTDFYQDLPRHAFDRISTPSEALALKNDGKLNLKMNISFVAEAGILISLSRRVDVPLGVYVDCGLLNMKRNNETSKMFTGPDTEYTDLAGYNVGNGITYNSVLNSWTRNVNDKNKTMVNKVSSLSYGIKLGVRIKLGKLSEKKEEEKTRASNARDTVYVYSNCNNMSMDSVLKEVLQALKDLPKGGGDVYNTYNYDEPNKKLVTDEDFDIYFPSHISQKELDILFRPIYFDLDKDFLRPESIRDLDKKAEILKKYPEIKLLIFGNTCDLGKDSHNYRLGERRAEKARLYLIKKGIDADRLDSSTLSKFQPERPNTSESNRMKNRRDDFRPIYPKFR